MNGKSPDTGTPMPARVAVLAQDRVSLAAAGALAHDLALPLIDSPSSDHDLLLVATAQRLELRDNRNPRVGAVYVDFGKPAPGRRLTAREPLVRAIGKRGPLVVDTTLGLGADAWRLADYGHNVIGIERHPVIAALLRDTLERIGDGRPRTSPGSAEAAASIRLRLIQGSAHDILPTLDPAPHVVYLDPMFPPKRRRSAAVSKEMRLLRLLAGDDIDARELFEIARRVARQRVVVKRPDHAEPLAPRPTVSYGGKLIRYDVYRTDLVQTP